VALLIPEDKNCSAVFIYVIPSLFGNALMTDSTDSAMLEILTSSNKLYGNFPALGFITLDLRVSNIQ
jgi:presenilin-like A22 family membrane protease